MEGDNARYDARVSTSYGAIVDTRYGARDSARDCGYRSSVSSASRSDYHDACDRARISAHVYSHVYSRVVVLIILLVATAIIITSTIPTRMAVSQEHVLLIGTKYFSFCARNGNHDFVNSAAFRPKGGTKRLSLSPGNGSSSRAVVVVLSSLRPLP